MARQSEFVKSVRPEIERFASMIGAVVEKMTTKRIAEEIKRSVKNGNGHKKRPKVLCYYPGCKNVAAPRFQMLCAAEHAKLSKEKRLKIAVAHKKKAAKA